MRGGRFAVVVAAIVLALNVPYLYRMARTPPGDIPYGCDLMNFGDLLTYVAWMKQAAQGHWLFINLYDPQPQPRILLLPLFLLLGRAGRLLSLPLILVWQLARVAFSVGLLATIRWFCRREARDPAQRGRAFLLLALGMGVPRIPEAVPVFSMFDHALHTFAWIVILLAAGHWLRACRSDGLAPGSTLAAGACGAVMLLTHHYDAVTFSVVVAATTAAQLWRTGRALVLVKGALVATVMAPFGALALWTARANPALAAFAMVPRVRWGWELPAFGTMLVMAVAGLHVGRKRGEEIEWLHVAWVAGALLLLYSPLPSPRRYIQGVDAPICLLAARGFDVLWRAGFRRLPNYCLVLAFPAAPELLAIDMMDIVPDLPRYISRSVVGEIEGLASLPPGLVMAPGGLDYLIPPFSGRQVFAGNEDQTPGYVRKLELFEQVRAGRIGGAELARLHVRYLVVPVEMPSGSWRGLRLVRRMRWLVLYEVAPSP